jgi:hypothetical protein
MLLQNLIQFFRAVMTGGRRTEDTELTVGITNYTILVTQEGANPL